MDGNVLVMTEKARGQRAYEDYLTMPGQSVIVPLSHLKEQVRRALSSLVVW